MKVILDFFKYEATGGILLAIAATIALIVKNTPLETFYDGFLVTPVVIQLGTFMINKPLLLWINDGLMAIFFLIVGLEIKYEMVIGRLSTLKQIALPSSAALGGIAFPALVYTYINWGNPIAMKGWAIPAATDIAFALGILSLLGKRVPQSLKVCLTAIAILDDLAAIIVIALFYTAELSLLSLSIGAFSLAVLATLNRRGITSLGPYIITGIILWACVLKSGVHATLAGVLLAFFIPLRTSDDKTKSPAKIVEHSLHPWVAYAILPLFAFANAGVSLQGLTLDVLLHPITIGIMAGLFLGKQIGVMSFTALGAKFKLFNLPTHVNWRQYYGMALITGVGFTMSLFIGTLAFDDVERQTYVRLGVLLGSWLSGLLGYILLRNCSNTPQASPK